MNTVNVVTEGVADLILLKSILPEEIVQRTNFISGNGFYSAQSLARSILAARQQPVALVVDSDAGSERAAFEREMMLREALHNASPRIPYKVLVVHPAVEIILFESKSLIESLAGDKFTDIQWTVARMNPKQFLHSTRFNIQKMNQVLSDLDDHSLENIRSNRCVIELLDFLKLMNNLRGFSVKIRPLDISSTRYIVELIPSELQLPLAAGESQRVPDYPKAIAELTPSGISIQWLVLPERFSDKENEFEAMVKLTIEDYQLK